MGLLDGLLGQLTSHVDIDGLAAKVGLDPAQVTAAIGALTQAHTEPGDTVGSAASATGLSPDILNQIVSHIGGEGSLGRFAEMLKEGGGGGILGTLGGLAGGLLGGKS
jgi:hypothetical protein